MSLTRFAVHYVIQVKIVSTMFDVDAFKNVLLHINAYAITKTA